MQHIDFLDSGISTFKTSLVNVATYQIGASNIQFSLQQQHTRSDPTCEIWGG